MMRKRLAWYGLDHLNLRRLEIDKDGDIVAELADSLATVTYEEVFDHRTGSRRSRTAHGCKAA